MKIGYFIFRPFSLKQGPRDTKKNKIEMVVQRGATGVATPPPFQISKIKEINKTRQKIEDHPLEKEEERKSCMFV